MSISREFKELLLSKIDLVDLVESKIPFKKKTGANFFACCPFHQEKSPSFSVNQQKQFFYCFGCGAKGNAIDFMIQYEKMDFKDAMIQLASYAGMALPKSSESEKPGETLDIYYEMNAQVARYYVEQLKENQEAIQYLKNRGINGETAREFKIGFVNDRWDGILQSLGQSPTNQQTLLNLGLVLKNAKGGVYDRFRHRIMFPIIDQRQHIIGFGGRILEHGDPKYLNSPESPIFHKGRALYGLYHALKTKRTLDRLIVVEGYLDVISLFQHGIQNAVATLGTATSVQHIQLLRRYSDEICFCFDGDAAGYRAAWRAVQMILPIMQADWKIRFLFLPAEHDPDSFVRAFGHAAFLNELEKTTPIAHFFLNYLSENNALASIEDRSRFAHQTLKHIESIRDPLCRTFFIEALAEKTKLKAQQLMDIQDQKPLVSEIKKFSGPPHSAIQTMPNNWIAPLQHLLSVLIQAPYLNPTLSLPDESDLPGFDFLKKILASIAQTKPQTTAQLLELWRDDPQLPWLYHFAAEKVTLPESKWALELQGLSTQLNHCILDQSIQQLLKDSQTRELTLDEKNKLTSLILKRKHPAKP